MEVTGFDFNEADSFLLSKLHWFSQVGEVGTYSSKSILPKTCLRLLLWHPGYWSAFVWYVHTILKGVHTLLLGFSFERILLDLQFQCPSFVRSRDMYFVYPHIHLEIGIGCPAPYSLDLFTYTYYIGVPGVVFSYGLTAEPTSLCTLQEFHVCTTVVSRVLRVI